MDKKIDFSFAFLSSLANIRSHRWGGKTQSLIHFSSGQCHKLRREIDIIDTQCKKVCLYVHVKSSFFIHNYNYIIARTQHYQVQIRLIIQDEINSYINIHPLPSITSMKSDLRTLPSTTSMTRSYIQCMCLRLVAQSTKPECRRRTLLWRSHRRRRISLWQSLRQWKSLKCLILFMCHALAAQGKVYVSNNW